MASTCSGPWPAGRGLLQTIAEGSGFARSHRFALGRVPEQAGTWNGTAPSSTATDPAPDALSLACFGDTRPGVGHLGHPAGESEPFWGSS